MSELCRSCGQSLLWAITTNGTPIPIDPEPSDRGTRQLRPSAPDSDVKLAIYVRESDRGKAKYAGRLYVQHKDPPPRRKHRPEPDPGLRYWSD